MRPHRLGPLLQLDGEVADSHCLAYLGGVGGEHVAVGGQESPDPGEHGFTFTFL